MPLSLNEIKDRALAFSREWEGERAEKAEAQTFWNEFFNVFGVSRKRLASFEALDKAVDAAYAGAGFKPAPTKSDAERVAFLFELYHRYTSMLPASEAPKRRKKK